MRVNSNVIRLAGLTMVLALLAGSFCGCAEPFLQLRNATTQPPETQEVVTLPPDTAPATNTADEVAVSTAPEHPVQTDAPAPVTEPVTQVIELEGGGPAQTAPLSVVVEPPVQSETQPTDTTLPEEPQSPTPPAENWAGWSEATPYYPSVLMYHLILDEPYTDLTGLFVRPAEFEDQLVSMSQAGCEFLFADEFACTAQKSVVLTFDDGYEDNYTEMFPILKKYGAKATVFMIAYKIDTPGYLTSAMIQEMAESGLVHFGSHTSSHPNLTHQSAAQLDDEFGGSASIISALTGRETTAVCYPGGFHNDYVTSEAAKWFRFGYTTVNDSDTSACNPLAICRVRVNRGMSGGGLLSRLRW